MLTALDFAYLLCFLLLLGMALFVGSRNWRSQTHRTFSLTALSLLGWLVTLFFFNRNYDPATVLWIGRVNFAAVVFAALFAYQFVRALASRKKHRWDVTLVVTAYILALVTVLTPLVDKAELVIGPASNHVTVYGSLFPAYVAYVAGLLFAATWLALTERTKHSRGPVRDQLTLVGAGTLATGLIALVANIVLPYAVRDFRFIDVGPLSTILFLAAVAYAIVKHGLFDIRLLVKKALVLGLLLTFALAAYSAVLVLVTEYFAAGSSGTLARFSVLLIAFGFDPVRRVLDREVERFVDRTFFRRRRNAS